MRYPGNEVGPGAYIFQSPFLRGLFLEGLEYGRKFALQNRLGLYLEANLRLKTDWASYCYTLLPRYNQVKELFSYFSSVYFFTLLYSQQLSMTRSSWKAKKDLV